MLLCHEMARWSCSPPMSVASGSPYTPSCEGCSSTTGWRSKNIHPNSILHIACFIVLCEAYLSMEPHWKLWRHMFSPRVNLDRGSQLFVGCLTIQLHGSRQASYMWIPPPVVHPRLRGRVVQRAKSWGRAPWFTGSIPVSKPEWNYGTKKMFKPKIDYMLVAIAK